MSSSATLHKKKGRGLNATCLAAAASFTSGQRSAGLQAQGKEIGKTRVVRYSLRDIMAGSLDDADADNVSGHQQGLSEFERFTKCPLKLRQ